MAIELIVQDGKTFARVADLQGWEKNPKTVTKEDYERLREQKKLGQYKPLLVLTDEGIVIGGNTRLKLYKEDGDELAWVSPIEFIEGTGEAEGKVRAVINGEVNTQRVFESKEQAMLEYALSDNDQIGRYDSQAVAELVIPYQNVLPMKDYKVDLSHPVRIQSILDSLQGSSVNQTKPEDRDHDEDDTDDKLDTYLHGTIRQIVLYFTADEYTSVTERLKPLLEKTGLPNNTDLFVHLLNFYEKHQDLDDYQPPVKEQPGIQDAEIVEEEHEAIPSNESES